MNKTKKINHKGQEGSSIFESMVAIILLCLIFFGVMQVFHFAMTQMVCNYAAFNGGKALSLGYTKRITDKTIRLSSLGISGKDRSKPKLNPKLYDQYDLRTRMQLYMTTGNANVDFEYWDTTRPKDPQLGFTLSQNYYNPALMNVQVQVKNAPMLNDGVAKLFQFGTDKASPKAKYNFFNHSEKYLNL